MSNGSHIYTKSYDMEKAKMCTYIKSDCAIPNWKFLLRCCAKFPCINITDQETNNQYSDTTLSIRFHIYQIIVLCTADGRLPLKDNIYVKCVNKNLHQMNLEKYTPEKSS